MGGAGLRGGRGLGPEVGEAGTVGAPRHRDDHRDAGDDVHAGVAGGQVDEREGGAGADRAGEGRTGVRGRRGGGHHDPSGRQGRRGGLGRRGAGGVRPGRTVPERHGAPVGGHHRGRRDLRAPAVGRLRQPPRAGPVRPEDEGLRGARDAAGGVLPVDRERGPDRVRRHLSRQRAVAGELRGDHRPGRGTSLAGQRGDGEDGEGAQDEHAERDEEGQAARAHAPASPDRTPGATPPAWPCRNPRRAAGTALGHGGRVPEGDTVFLLARRLHARLAGRPVHRSDLRVPRFATADLSGTHLVEVVSRGKHLLTRLVPGDGAVVTEPTTLHTHLRMDGEWTVLGPGKRLPARLQPDVRVVLETDGPTAVALRMPVVELVPTALEHTVVGHLGRTSSGRTSPSTSASSGPSRTSRCGPSGGSRPRSSTSATWRGSATSGPTSSASCAGGPRGRRSGTSTCHRWCAWP